MCKTATSVFDCGCPREVYFEDCEFRGRGCAVKESVDVKVGGRCKKHATGGTATMDYLAQMDALNLASLKKKEDSRFEEIDDGYVAQLGSSRVWIKNKRSSQAPPTSMKHPMDTAPGVRISGPLMVDNRQSYYASQHVSESQFSQYSQYSQANQSDSASRHTRRDSYSSNRPSSSQHTNRDSQSTIRPSSTSQHTRRDSQSTRPSGVDSRALVRTTASQATREHSRRNSQATIRPSYSESSRAPSSSTQQSRGQSITPSSSTQQSRRQSITPSSSSHNRRSSVAILADQGLNLNELPTAGSSSRRRTSTSQSRR